MQRSGEWGEIALGKVRLSPFTGSVVLFNPRKKGNPINPGLREGGKDGGPPSDIV